MKGGWKETRGIQRPISAKPPVSESRMASLNPFETKRKKALSGASSRVRDVQVAEGMGLTSNLLHPKSLILLYLALSSNLSLRRRPVAFTNHSYPLLYARICQFSERSPLWEIRAFYEYAENLAHCKNALDFTAQHFLWLRVCL